MSLTPLETLQQKFPQWRAQSERLHNLLGQHAPKIFIPGPRDFDKSLLVRQTLALHDMRIAYVRASEFFWNRSAFFERICAQLFYPASVFRSLMPSYPVDSGIVTMPKNRIGQGRVPSAAVFVEKLKDIFLRLNPPERACIFIEDVDRLDPKVFGDNIVSIFLRLEELTSVPIAVIMTASCDWTSVLPEFPAQNPVILTLPGSTQNNLVQLLRDCEPSLPKIVKSRLDALQEAWSQRCVPRGWNSPRDLYNLFVFNIVQSLRVAYPTKRELLMIACAVFPRYLEPTLRALESESELPDSVALYSQIAPLFQIIKDLPSLMFLEEELEKYYSKLDGRSIVQNTSSAMDFPLICKYLLLAGWIGARNPTIDAEIRDRRRRRKGGVNEASRLEKQKDMPPSAWRIDKLLSILDHLLAGNEEEEIRADEDAIPKLSTTSKEDEELRLFQAQFAEQPQVDPSHAFKEALKTSPEAILPSKSLHTAENGVNISNPTEVDYTFDSDGISLGGSEDDLPSDSGSDVAWGAIELNEAVAITGEDLDDEFEQEYEFVPDPVHFDSPSLFPLLWEAKRGHAGQLEILSQIAVLEQIGLFIRSAASTSKTTRGRSEYKCGYDWEFVHQIANSINFPLWGFL